MIRQIIRFEAQKLLRISDLRLESCWPSYYNHRKSVTRPNENGVAYKEKYAYELKDYMMLMCLYHFRP